MSTPIIPCRVISKSHALQILAEIMRYPLHWQQDGESVMVAMLPNGSQIQVCAGIVLIGPIKLTSIPLYESDTDIHQAVNDVVAKAFTSVADNLIASFHGDSATIN